MPASRNALETGLDAAFARFLTGYHRWGGYRFHGWTNQEDPRNYRGPAIWSEADCVHRLARELEVEFPDRVHLELKIAQWTTVDFDRSKDKVQSIDLAVTDFSSFEEDEHSQEQFRGWTHEIFIEAKWLGKGWWGEAWEMDARGQVPSVISDVQRLARHVEVGRCLMAGMLVVDDEGFFEAHSEDFDWPPTVKRLVASPGELERAGYRDERVASELARIISLRQREAELSEAKRAEQARLEELAGALVGDVPQLRQRVGRLRVKEFEAVTARAIAEENAEALVALEARASGEKNKRWGARLEQIREELRRTL